MADIEVITLSQAVETIKTATLQSQARAARNISANQLALYFSVGGYISLNTRQQQWGCGAIETISERLQKELPGLLGFSPTSIKNMRQFYETWCSNVFRQPVAGELKEYERAGRKFSEYYRNKGIGNNNYWAVSNIGPVNILYLLNLYLDD